MCKNFLKRLYYINGDAFSFRMLLFGILILSDVCRAQSANKVSSRICKRLTYSDSVEFICYQYRDGPRVDCKSAVLLEGYIIKMKCKRFYHENNKVPYDETICRSNGEWSNPPLKCYPDCGQPYGHPTELISHAQPAKYGDSPWHAVIYDRKERKMPIIICGGTIISPTLIVSAAHCFYNEEKETPFAPENYEIVVNKISSDYNNSDLNRAGRYEIQRMIFNPEVKYYGSHSNYESDIIILQLKEKIKISSHVLPACVNLKESGTFGLGEYRGKISGFGLDENGELSKVLKTVTLPYISRNDCLQKVNPDFRSSIALDKFCAGSTSLTDPGAQQGDSGGGFLYRDPQSTLYYLRGVVSIKDKSSEASLTVFTDITSHIKWIGDVMNQEQNEQNLLASTEHESFTTATDVDTTTEGQRKHNSNDSNDADNEQDKNRLDWTDNQGLFRSSTLKYSDLDFPKSPPTRSNLDANKNCSYCMIKAHCSIANENRSIKLRSCGDGQVCCPPTLKPDLDNQGYRPPIIQTPQINVDSISRSSPANAQCVCVAKSRCTVFLPQQMYRNYCGDGQICCPQSDIQSSAINVPARLPLPAMSPANNGGFMQWYTVTGPNGPRTCICTIVDQCSNPLLNGGPFNLACGEGKVCCLKSGPASGVSSQTYSQQPQTGSNGVQTQWYSTSNGAPVTCFCTSINQCVNPPSPNIDQLFNCGEGQVCCPQAMATDPRRSDTANLQTPSWNNDQQVQWYTVSGTNGATTCICTFADQCSNPLDGGVFNLDCGVGKVCCIQSPDAAKQLVTRSTGSNRYQPSNTGIASYQWYSPLGGPTHTIYSNGVNFLPGNTLPVHNSFTPSNSNSYNTLYKEY